MKEKTMNEWLMLLKTVPDNVFIEFFADNPEMRYVAQDYDWNPLNNPNFKKEDDHEDL